MSLTCSGVQAVENKGSAASEEKIMRVLSPKEKRLVAVKIK